MADINHAYTDQIVCPWCGHEHQHSWEYQGDTIDCVECDRRFDVERDTSVTYTTSRLVKCECGRRDKHPDRTECYLCRDDAWRAKQAAKLDGSL